MRPSNHESNLPQVTDLDIAASFGEDVANNDPQSRWEQLAQDNPLLAHEIRNRAYTEATLSDRADETRMQHAYRMLHFATYIVAIIQRASERSEEIRRTTTLNFSDGDDGVDQPL